MQSKGAISLLAVLIALACLYQLSFTAVSVIQQNKAEKFAEAAVMAEQQKPSFAEVSDLDKAYYLDTEYIPTQVQVGTKVTWTYNGNTYTGRVTLSDLHTFYVLPDNPELIVTGMSGSVVSGLGFISSYTVDGLLKVVYF